MCYTLSMKDIPPKPFFLTTAIPMDNEFQLINVAAWLWEVEDLIWAEMCRLDIGWATRRWHH